MPSYCVLLGCNNKPSELITLHQFPKDKDVCQDWIKFVCNRQPNWKLKKTSCLCSVHFLENDFLNWQQVVSGYAKKLQRKTDAIPSVYTDERDNVKLEETTRRDIVAQVCHL